MQSTHTWLPVKIISAFLAVPFIFYLGFLNHTEPTELGVARNVLSGEILIQEGGGWHLTPPWVLVSVIGTRPMKVEIPTSGHGYKAKLVQFNVREWRKFIETEGFHYWWWANRISFNSGYETYRGMKDLMRGYAFSAKQYPFVQILEQY
ncbi:MAG: hypothetical protein HGA61_03550 [Candidatus Moranbacteria bacterium]|nr:hypothetical protein [Candidatus Moranbacteria bacterium]